MANTEIEELAVSFSDIDGKLSQPVLEDRVMEITEDYDLVYREAFQDYDATNANSNVIDIPVSKGDMGRPKIIEEGAEFPRDQEHYETQRLTFDMFGFEVALTDRAIRNSQVDLTNQQVDEQTRQMMEEMNEQAFNVITGSLQGNLVSDNQNGTLTFEDVLAGREELVSQSFNPDLLIADVQGIHDLMGDSNFLNATDAQSEMRRSGQLGQLAGMDVIEDDSGLNLTGTSDPGALMVDTDYFGWEGERTPVTTDTYEENNTRSEVYQIFNERGWLVSQPEAGVIVQG